MNPRLQNILLLARSVDLVANHRLAAGLYYRGRPVAYGYARYKTHPEQARANALRPYLHAEFDCLLRAARQGFSNWRKAELYVARSRKDGSPGLAKPCPTCAELIDSLGIIKVHYTI